MGKRGNGEGSIYRRKDGRWVGQYLVYTDKGPKYKYIYGKTRQAVAGKLTKAMADRDGGLVFDTGSLTLGNYLDRWLPNIHDTVRQRTWERYEQIVRVHLKPALERVMNSAEKPHWDADFPVSSVLRRSPVFRISKPFLSKFITASRAGQA